MIKNAEPLTSLVEPVLLNVARPARYVGAELNVVRKRPGDQNVRVCLAFPDVYDIGQSYLGFHILYEILNRRPGTLCERTFAPWPDMATVMRERSIPLWSLENILPVSSFDIVGFTLQYELHYTTVLDMLDLAGIPLLSRERSDVDPFIIGGGTCCSNPEPMADFFDAFLLGDGEEAFPEIAAVVERCRANDASRTDTLRELARVGGVYVPSFYEVHYDADGAFTGVTPTDDAARPVIEARIVESMLPEHYPQKPLVPLTEIVHDRLAVEIMRGCGRGCRFCGAGMTYRPRRTRSVEDVVDHVVGGIKATGWEEVSLVSLSTTDHPGIKDIVRSIGERLGNKGVSISLSSLRADSFSLDMAEATAGGRKTGLTFAVEAGTQRLRNVINKTLTEQQLLETVNAAMTNGWPGLKLYFMIGLPTETDEDVEGIARVLTTVAGIMKTYKSRHLNVTVSPFTPKPQTPFQWEAQEDADSLRDKVRTIERLVTARFVKIKASNPVVSLLEGKIARGDRRVGAIVLEAWRRGCRLDGWTEHFKRDVWRDVFAESGIDFTMGDAGFTPGGPLPWGHLHFGVTEAYMLSERERSRAEHCTSDCAEQCHACGPYASFCDAQKSTAVEPPPRERLKLPVMDARFGRRNKPAPQRGTVPLFVGTRIRVQYAKHGPARYVGHLDLVRVFDRTLRRAGIPVAYSQGFHPHPKISFGHPLSLGMTSSAEYVDVTLAAPYPEFATSLAATLPEGFDLIETRSIPERAPSLVSAVECAAYTVTCIVDERLIHAVGDLLARDSAPVTRMTKKGDKTVDIRPGIMEITVLGDGSGFTMLLSLSTHGSVKPLEVFSYLFENDPPRDVERTAQYLVVGDTRMTPFDILGT